MTLLGRPSRARSCLVTALAIAPALALLTVGAPAAAQGKSITLSMLAGYKEDVLRASLPEFEKKTGIKVVVDSAPFGDLYKKQLLSLSTGGRYDVLFMDEPWIAPLSEFLLPLNERMKTLELKDFVPTTVAAGAFQGTQYAVPVDPNVQLLVYRKDLFDQKGLKPPPPGTSCSRPRRPSTIPPSSSTGSPSPRAATSRPGSTCCSPCGPTAPSSWTAAVGAVSTRRPAGRAAKCFSSC